MDPFDVAHHIGLGVSSAHNWQFSLQKFRQGGLPLSRTPGVSESGMEQDETVKVRIVGSECASFVKRVEVLHECRDLHVVGYALNYPTEGIGESAVREGVLEFPTFHGFRADEEQVERGTREHVGQLVPDIAGEGGFGTRSKDEEADGWWGGADILDVPASTGRGRVEGVAECWWGVLVVGLQRHGKPSYRRNCAVPHSSTCF